MEFYNVKKRAKVQIAEAKCTKVVYERTTKAGTKQKRYAVKAVDDDKTHLTKFVTQAVYDKLTCKKGK